MGNRARGCQATFTHRRPHPALALPRGLLATSRFPCGCFPEFPPHTKTRRGPHGGPDPRSPPTPAARPVEEPGRGGAEAAQTRPGPPEGEA